MLQKDCINDARLADKMAAIHKHAIHKQATTMHQHVVVQHVVVEDELETEIAEKIDYIKGQLSCIMVRFRRIVRHVKKPVGLDDYESRSREDDLQQLKDMYDELKDVETRHPHCTGCNPDFQPNQQAHYHGDGDNADIDNAIDELLKK